VSKEFVVVILLGVAGFLAGGVYATWKSARSLAVVLGVAAAVAVGGAVLWLA
jgi:hypothetical protein